jgi:coenzyme Q-binding protein COQ10
MIHNETATSQFTAEQLFDLVLDVEKYPEFLPWCSNVKITERKSAKEFYAELTVNFKAFTYTYTSLVSGAKQKNGSYLLEVEMVKGPFKHLFNSWKFTSNKKNTLIDFTIDMELKSRLLSKLLDVIFEIAFKKMLSAFQKRAEEVYNGF